MTANRNQIEEAIQNKLSRFFSVAIEEADANQMYKATVLTVRDILAQKRKLFNAETRAQGKKKVYYMCMEFLMGTSLRTNLNNLGLEAAYKDVLKNTASTLTISMRWSPTPAWVTAVLADLRLALWIRFPPFLIPHAATLSFTNTVCLSRSWQRASR